MFVCAQFNLIKKFICANFLFGCNVFNALTREIILHKLAHCTYIRSQLMFHFNILAQQAGWTGFTEKIIVCSARCKLRKFDVLFEFTVHTKVFVWFFIIFVVLQS